MDKALAEQLSSADFDAVCIRILHHADIMMRRYIWRGRRASVGANGELIVDGHTADDFLQIALAKLCEGTRKYRPDRSLEDNLRGIVESLIWSRKKGSDRKPLVEVEPVLSPDGDELNPLEQAADPRSEDESEVVDAETRRNQEAAFAEFMQSFDGDHELAQLTEAYATGFENTGDISQLTGIPPARVSELKRKLRSRACAHFGVKTFEQLNSKLTEGE